MEGGISGRQTELSQEQDANNGVARQGKVLQQKNQPLLMKRGEEEVLYRYSTEIRIPGNTNP